MPAPASDTSYLTVSQAVPKLTDLTGLNLNYDMLRKRLRRAKCLPFTISRMYLQGQGRGRGRACDYLQEDDLPKIAEWLQHTV